MTYTEGEYLEMAIQGYKDPDPDYPKKASYSTNLGGKDVAASTHGTDFESNGLQASIVKGQGQTTIVFRGSQDMDTSMLNPDVSQRTDGAKDWNTDLFENLIFMR
ncbi:hypothetical protein OfM1_14750 [Lactovum odontotermitis]